MTREEAIKGLKVLAKDFSGYKPNEEMFDMAIKALEQPERDDCNTCKYHGYFGSVVCNNCRVRYPSYWESREGGQDEAEQ